MASITDLTYTNNMAANKKPLLTDLVESLDSIQTYINDSIKDNLVQLASDCLPSGYAFDNDGAKNFSTHDLFDKQTANDSYTGGNIAISTTGSWLDVDTSNAAVTFTPDLLAGDFKATFMFSLQSVTSNATNETDVRFRLTDSSTNSTFTPRVHLVTGVTTTTNTVPVIVEHTFNSLAASAQTIKLQYNITTTTNTTITVLANTNDPIYMEVEKV